MVLKKIPFLLKRNISKVHISARFLPEHFSVEKKMDVFSNCLQKVCMSARWFVSDSQILLMRTINSFKDLKLHPICIASDCKRR